MCRHVSKDRQTISDLSRKPFGPPQHIARSGPASTTGCTPSPSRDKATPCHGAQSARSKAETTPLTAHAPHNNHRSPLHSRPLHPPAPRLMISFNGNCRFGPSCRYPHKCAVCGVHAPRCSSHQWLLPTLSHTNLRSSLCLLFSLS